MKPRAASRPWRSSACHASASSSLELATDRGNDVRLPGVRVRSDLDLAHDAGGPVLDVDQHVGRLRGGEAFLADVCQVVVLAGHREVEFLATGIVAPSGRMTMSIAIFGGGTVTLMVVGVRLPPGGLCGRHASGASKPIAGSVKRSATMPKTLVVEGITGRQRAPAALGAHTAVDGSTR